MTLPLTMKAVVFDRPYKVSIQDRPVPRVQDDGDIVVKVEATAICGSDLHVYRGLERTTSGTIMGHEFTGIVVEVGPKVRTFKIGDKVVSPFTVSCGDCFYCRNGWTSRCVDCLVFGSERLDGAQAQFVRVPLADSTAFKAPEGISNNALILMADVFPTGYFGVKSAMAMSPSVDGSTIVIIGCGPVGLCAIVSALHFRQRNIFAIDGIESRLKIAENLGAIPLNFKDGLASMQERVWRVTEGRGADMVVEVVGKSPALRTAYELVRPFGTISSIGVHNAEIPWSGAEAYGKNLRVQMGRCPVRHVFSECLPVLEQVQTQLEFMFDHILPLSSAVEGFAAFDRMEVQKVVLKP
ncbi:chaperonin 10-like protein [Truncatella angustata]|uniref:Chaperonin 10-like protein n=1 Tax=Truncatella angustata TaxID=152316 RepID=A0A9P8ZUN2_9PEZI|nr:chaperonin 10-like protein [Truncatella angustata]KAH6649191.1 chaperonin 10-like protein [Truncatella angustata]